MLLFEWASLFETVGFKLVEGKGLREGRDSKELWKSVDKSKAPRAKPAREAPAPGKLK
jgi:hypothetical protein